MIVREWLDQARERLSGFPTPEVDARLLLEHALKMRPLRMQEAIDDLELANRLLNRRAEGEPVQYITGEAPFRYLVLAVGPGVLIPRPETELLVDVALKAISELGAARVADLGAGSGAIAISLATESQATVYAVEKDPSAFAWLRKNAEQFAPTVESILSDINDLQLHDVDVVVANPPYVPDHVDLPREIVDYEPSLAIFGGVDGTDLPMQFLKAAHRILRSGGLLIMEHSDSHQEKIVAQAAMLFAEVQAHRDLLDRPRFITARKA